MNALRPEVAARIRRAMATDASVLSGSLPVVAFGDPERATVATLSLNPSWREFQGPDGEWLHGPKQRLASLPSLGARDPRDLTDAQVAQVVSESNSYFLRPSWYRAWFHWLESLLNGAARASYLDGTACHLDLVQWATKPAQGQLPPPLWKRLVAEDCEFLCWQLRNTDVRVVLLNGAAVVKAVIEAGVIRDMEEEVLEYDQDRQRRLRTFRGMVDGVLFLGWNMPLAGALAAMGRQRLEEWVTSAIRDRVPDQVPRPVDGDLEPSGGAFLEPGAVASSPAALQDMLAQWLAHSAAMTVGEVGTFGGSPVIAVRIGTDEFALNRDTKRSAVEAFLSAAHRAGGAGSLVWRVVGNSRGTINRVTYRDDEEPTPGWYAYLRRPATLARRLGLPNPTPTR